ncbi:MAG: hypothetical protein VBE63_01950 [Lamprobacter sp.]|uniref:hypothetical protein n=1 Tax=Lamprobacter sp. TaxID=3100796 RepID=UPI002B26145C|nr:hypothetical protein [Lamprobacter sp.]MEA3638691.1 hypothetical protein [Lamprobacter sp.]
MTLRQKDISFIKENLGDWLEELALISPVRNQQDQLERLEAIEEALEQQRRLIKRQGEQLDRRVSGIQQTIERQQESSETRLTSIRDEIEQRLSRLEKRIEATDKRSQGQEKHFPHLQEVIEQQGKDINRRISRSLLLTFLVIVVIGALIGIEVMKLITTGSLI